MKIDRSKLKKSNFDVVSTVLTALLMILLQMMVLTKGTTAFTCEYMKRLSVC
jgi:hypothetical protein